MTTRDNRNSTRPYPTLSGSGEYQYTSPHPATFFPSGGFGEQNTFSTSRTSNDPLDAHSSMAGLVHPPPPPVLQSSHDRPFAAASSTTETTLHNSFDNGAQNQDSLFDQQTLYNDLFHWNDTPDSIFNAGYSQDILQSGAAALPQDFAAVPPPVVPDPAVHYEQSQGSFEGASTYMHQTSHNDSQASWGDAAMGTDEFTESGYDHEYQMNDPSLNVSFTPLVIDSLLRNHHYHQNAPFRYVNQAENGESEIAPVAPQQNNFF